MLGQQDGTPQVVRQRAPARRSALAAAAVLVGLFAFYVDLRVRPLQRRLRPPGRRAAAHRARGADRAPGEGQPRDAHQARGARHHPRRPRARAGRSGARHGRPAGAGGAPGAGAGLLPRRRRAGRRAASGSRSSSCASPPARAPARFIVHLSLVRTGSADARPPAPSSSRSMAPSAPRRTRSTSQRSPPAARARVALQLPLLPEHSTRKCSIPANFKPEQLSVEVLGQEGHRAPVADLPLERGVRALTRYRARQHVQPRFPPTRSTP